MNINDVIVLYLLIATALSLTTLFTVYFPALKLANEILDEERYTPGIRIGITWVLVTTVLFPMVAFIVLTNRSKQLENKLALVYSGTDDE